MAAEPVSAQRPTAAPADDTLERLFQRRRRFRDDRAREELIERFRPFAIGWARRYHAPGGEPFEDLVQVAMLGLIKAVDRYDPDRGVAFVSFAEPTIRGELRRHFRDATWAIHVPRELQERVRLVERETERLAATLGRSPTAAELADVCELDVADALEAHPCCAGDPPAAARARRDGAPKAVPATPATSSSSSRSARTPRSQRSRPATAACSSCASPTA